MNSSENAHMKFEKLTEFMKSACKKIAPVWPLENFVAVNPYLGLTEKKFENAAQELAHAGDVQMTLPMDFYLQKIKSGEITNKDLAGALKEIDPRARVSDFLRIIKERSKSSLPNAALPTLADIAGEVTGKDWNRFLTARISVWAASYFDKGQAIWSATNTHLGVFNAWKTESEIDRSPEIAGLIDFRKYVKNLPSKPIDATSYALRKLGMSEEELPGYLHRILLRSGGWAAYAARLDWEDELYGRIGGTLSEFLTILICWEACLFESIATGTLESEWKTARGKYILAAAQKGIDMSLAENLILQNAFDRAAQRQLIEKFNRAKPNSAVKERAKAQAVFCIDVRSEVYRRNLEAVDSRIDTLGFAGFFAFPINFRPIGQEVGEAQCPVLLKTGPTIPEEISNAVENERVLSTRIFKRQVQQVWKSFKSGAVTCFSFVSPLGLSYLPKLFSDSFGLTRPVADPETFGIAKSIHGRRTVRINPGNVDKNTVGIVLADQIQMAKNALTAMSLTDHFAPFVLIVGHGATMVNNPHATGYDCGACGGHKGEANAKVAVAVLNNPEVRAGLKKEGIEIPRHTTFLACLHDTTTDVVSIFNENEVPEVNAAALTELKNALTLAGKTTRTERGLRLPVYRKSKGEGSLFYRSKDWSQVIPEWGLAGCSNFIVAPRALTTGLDLEGKSFLHSYDWRKDKDFSVLELIMTAPMVVTTWINLQYYGSTVDQKNFGSGNKTLHNVTGGIGVLEGYSGDLRVGLPLQAVYDGVKYQHEPLRLNCVIDAPVDAMNKILEKHASVRELCDNGWMHLLALDENGKIAWRYAGGLKWESTRQIAA